MLVGRGLWLEWLKLVGAQGAEVIWWSLPSIREDKTISMDKEMSLTRKKRRWTMQRPSECVLGELSIECFKKLEEDHIAGEAGSFMRNKIY